MKELAMMGKSVVNQMLPATRRLLLVVHPLHLASVSICRVFKTPVKSVREDVGDTKESATP